MKYRTFASKRDELLSRMEEAKKAALLAEGKYREFILSTAISEEAKGFQVFLDALIVDGSRWRVYEHSRHMLMNGHQTIGYRRSRGDWVWMIDAGRSRHGGWSSADPHEVLAVLRDSKI